MLNTRWWEPYSLHNFQVICISLSLQLWMFLFVSFINVFTSPGIFNRNMLPTTLYCFHLPGTLSSSLFLFMYKLVAPTCTFSLIRVRFELSPNLGQHEIILWNSFPILLPQWQCFSDFFTLITQKFEASLTSAFNCMWELPVFTG